MPRLARMLVTFLAPFLITPTSAGQSPSQVETSPFQQTETRSSRDLNHLEALRLFGLGRWLERKCQVVEAIQSYEDAIQLDPAAPSLHKALIPLYLSLDRIDDGIGKCRKTLELDADDYEIWYCLGMQLNRVAQLAEAQTSLVRALACSGLREHPDAYAQIAFDLSKLYDNSKDYIRALGVLENIIPILGDEGNEVKMAEIYQAITQIAMKAGQNERAIQALLRTQSIWEHRDSFKARRLDYPLAQAYAALGKPELALAKLDQFLLTQPAGIDPFELKIRLLRQTGHEREIVRFLKAATGRDPNNATLKLLLGQHLVLETQYREAEQLYMDMASQAPSPEVYQGLFRLYRRQGRMEEALTLLDKAVAAGVDDNHDSRDAGERHRARGVIIALRDNLDLARALIPPARTRLQANQKLESDTRRFLAVIAMRTRQLDDAERLYLSLLDESQETRVQAAIFGGLLQILWQSGKYERVVEVCRNGLQNTHNNNQLLHSNLSRALVILGKLDEALAEADQAVRISDDENRLHFRLLRADVFRMSEKYELAEAECFTLLKAAIKPEDIREIRYNLSSIYSAANQVEKAKEQLRQILQMDPDDATASNDLGYIMADHNQNLEEAEKLIRKALDLDAEQRGTRNHVGGDDDRPNAAYMDSLGWVLFRRGLPEEALRELERAAALPEGETDPVVWDHLGDVYFQLGDYAKARSAWQKGAKLCESEKRRKVDKQYKELKRKLELLESQIQPQRSTMTDGGEECTTCSKSIPIN